MKFHMFMNLITFDGHLNFVKNEECAFGQQPHIFLANI